MNSTESTGSDDTPSMPLSSGGEPSNGKRKAAIPFILLTLFIDILGIGIIIPVLPELVKDFVSSGDGSGLDSDAIDSLAGWYVGMIGASYALMQFLFAPILGALSDRFGRRPIILGSLFGLGIDFLVQGFAPSIGWLFWGRLLAGIMGGSFSAANAYIADVSTPETRARNFGFVGMIFGLGFIFGPALGGLLGGIHLRLPFFVSAALALVNWLYGYFVLPESLPPHKRSSFTVGKANPFGTVGRLRAYPIIAGLTLSFLCFSLAQRGLENVWVLYTGHRFGWNEMTNGLVLGLVGITAAIVQGGLVRPVIARIGERKAILAGTAVSAVSFCCYGFASEGWMMLVIIVFGSLGGIAGPAIQSLVAGEVDSSEQGKIQGALSSLVGFTNIIAPAVFTTGLFSYFTSKEAIFYLPGAPFLAGSCLIVIGLVIAVMVFRRFPEKVAAE